MLKAKEEITVMDLQKNHSFYEGQVNLNFPEVTREERIMKKTTALIVELGELANESESFFKFFKINHRDDKEKQLKESADCLAYYMGLANDMHMQLREPKVDKIENLYITANEAFQNAVYNTSCIYRSYNSSRKILLLRSFMYYLKFLELIEIDFEEVKETYNNKVLSDNLKRQLDKY